MLPGIHFFVGSALGLLTKNYFYAFLIGFISHHVTDRLPHLDINIFRFSKNKDYKTIKDWDLNIWILVLSEFLFFLILTFYFIGNFDIKFQKLSLIGGLGAIFPDIFTFVFRLFLPQNRLFNFYFNFHKNFHFKLDNKNLILPIVIEILLIIFCYILFSGSKDSLRF